MRGTREARSTAHPPAVAWLHEPLQCGTEGNIGLNITPLPTGGMATHGPTIRYRGYIRAQYFMADSSAEDIASALAMPLVFR